MSRVTRKMVELQFAHFAEYIGMATDESKPHVKLDHYAPGGNTYTYRVVIVHPERGYCEETPFGKGRMTAKQMYTAMEFAMNVKQYQEKGQNNA